MTNWVYFRGATLPDGRVLPKADVCISPDDRGFVLGDGVYEVIRVYQGRLFRAREHLDRLARSLAAVRITLADTAGLAAIVRALLVRNGLPRADAIAYLQVTRGTAERTLVFPDPATPPTVYVAVSALTPLPSGTGAAVMTVPDIRWGRCDIKSVNLLASLLARQTAADRGVDEAVFVRDGVITEGTHTNIFGVRDGVVRTHPANHHILAGITRATVLELCAELGIPVQEKGIPALELARCDEVFLACTTAEVIPVLTVDGVRIGDGLPGSVTGRLGQAFRTYVARILAQPGTGCRGP